MRVRCFSITRSGSVGLWLALCTYWTGCQKAPSDLREWTPKDHTNQTNQAAVANRQVAANPTPEDSPPPGLDAVTLAAWATNCASCHGKVGRGDGPQGPMVKAPDLSSPEWQLQVTDSQIRQTIVSGKKSMPSFVHLPATTLDGLTSLVRWFNRDQAALRQRMSPGASPTTSGVSTSGASTSGAPATGPVVAASSVTPGGADGSPKPPVNSTTSGSSPGADSSHP